MTQLGELISDAQNHGKIVIASYDAGGAQVLSSLIKARGFLNFKYLLSGPALSIFTAKVKMNKSDLVHELCDDTSLLISGTGWQTNFEVSAIQKCTKEKIPVIAALDHWSRYKNRFFYQSQHLIPDYLLVFDDVAKNLASTLFPQVECIQEENYFLKDIATRYQGIIHGLKMQYDILYLGEPAHKDTHGYEEEEVIIDLVVNLKKEAYSSIRMLVRPHPSMNPEFYEKAFKALNSRVTISIDTDLAEDLARSKYIIGCQSMALVAATYCSKEVFYASSSILLENILPIKMKSLSMLLDLLSKTNREIWEI
jgi:hypothetical protein